MVHTTHGLSEPFIHGTMKDVAILAPRRWSIWASQKPRSSGHSLDSVSPAGWELNSRGQKKPSAQQGGSFTGMQGLASLKRKAKGLTFKKNKSVVLPWFYSSKHQSLIINDDYVSWKNKITLELMFFFLNRNVLKMIEIKIICWISCYQENPSRLYFYTLLMLEKLKITGLTFLWSGQVAIYERKKIKESKCSF